MSDIKISTKVTPALHVHNIETIEGLDDKTRPYIGPVATAMDEAYKGIESIYTAREAAAKNPAWTEAQQLLQVAQFAEKRQNQMLKRIDSVTRNLETQIKATDEMLQGPLEQQAGLGSVNEEIRRHVKGLSTDERHKFLQEANENGDTKTMTAVLGVPHYLTGMTATEQQHYLRLYHMRRNPDAAARLKVMQAALEILNTRAPLIHGEIEKAMGHDWRKVKSIREASSAAEQAFIIQDNSNSAV